jgi:hypothetical protein
MCQRWLCALLLGAGIASAQTILPDLQNYLSLTDVQVKSINDLNAQLIKFNNDQQQQIGILQSQIANQRCNASPDSKAVGDAYAQIEMLNRASNDQLAQTQSKIAAVLTTDQVMQVNGLLNIERLMPLVTEAQCIHLGPIVAVPIYAFANALLGIAPQTVCKVPPVPTALANYLNLTDSQIASIEAAIAANQDYISRQDLKIQELQNDIKDQTAAPAIDSAALGADYVAMWQIRRDESMQTGQLTTMVRSILSDQQQPQLQALDNAVKLSGVASEAVSSHILVLPPDLQNSSLIWFNVIAIPIPTVIPACSSPIVALPATAP